jgi:hypothetical protein
MSAGAFANSFYETDSGEFAAVRVQPETINAFNPAGAGPATIPGKVPLTRGRRTFGIRPRIVYGVWTTAPTGYKSGATVRVSIMTPTAYQAIAIDDDLTYNGGTFRVTGKTGESGV